MLSQALSNERLSIFDIIILTTTVLFPVNFQTLRLNTPENIRTYIRGGLIAYDVFVITPQIEYDVVDRERNE